MTSNRIGSALAERPWLAAVLAALLAAGVYANTLANGFAYDDHHLVETNAAVHGLGDIGGLLTREYWGDSQASGLYRPITMLSFATDWSLWDGRPAGFHLTNVLLHAAVTLLLTLLLLRYFDWRGALVGGLVFAVHPVHTEAVANVVGRAELLAAGFALAACVIYVTETRDRSRPRGRAVALIGACYLLASLSKEVGIVLPALLVLTEVPALARSGREAVLQTARSRWPVYACLAAVFALVMTIRWSVLGAAVESVPARAFVPDSSFATRLLTMARVWPRYFELLLFPTELSADYSPAVILPARTITVIGLVGFLLVGSVFALAVAARRRAPELTLSVGWAVVAILPVSNLLFVSEVVLAERTLYLGSAAVSFAAALAVTRPAPGRRSVVVLAIAAWIIGFGAMTVRRNPVWRSTVAVFEDLRRRHPESSRLLWEIGRLYEIAGRWPEARAFYERSLEVWPHHAPYLGELAVDLMNRGHLESADSLATRAIRIDAGVRGHHQVLALTRVRAGRYAAALRAVEAGRAAVGEDAVLRTLEAEAQAALGRYDAAVRAQAAAIRAPGSPNAWQLWYRLAQLHAAAGDTGAALAAVDSARSAFDAPDAPLDSLARSLTEVPRAATGRHSDRNRGP